MKAEEQLELAYITIAELRDQNTKLIDMMATLERRMASSANEERRVMENFYRNQMEGLKEAHQKELDKQRQTVNKLTRQVEELTSQIMVLTSRLIDAQSSAKSSKARESAARAELYGDSSEKKSRLGKRRKDDDRTEGKDNFDGTPGSDASTGDGDVQGKRAGKANRSGKDVDTIAGIQKKILRTHPGAEVSVERIDYSKAKFYMDQHTLHKLDEYYVLPEGGRFLTRKGKIDLNYVRIIIRYPERYEEHVYETATVRFKDAEDIRTVDTIPDLDRPIKGCCFGTSTIAYVLMEKFWYNTPLLQIVRKLRMNGVRMSKGTLGDNVHRAIDYIRERMTECWEKAMLGARYWLLDETPGLVGCDEEDGGRSYKKKYFWTITAMKLGLTWLSYENGSRGKAAIAKFLDQFIGFYTTDGYACYKLWDMPDVADMSSSETDIRKRSACLVHIRRPFVKSLQENYDESMWFIEVMSNIFALEHSYKEKGLTGTARWIERRKTGGVMDLMGLIETKLNCYRDNGFVGCGELFEKAVKYALAEWPAMKRVLDNGDVEISNNLSEQSVRKLKMNLRNAGNIGSEASAKNNAFMYSLIESCRHNKLDPGKYISFLLDKLKSSPPDEDRTHLLPCYCGAL